MDDCIIISNLNDFVFCPASIYFHNLYGSMDRMTYQGLAQLNGTKAHKAVDNQTYSTKKNIIMAKEVYSEKYHIVGKIDIYDADKKTLIERKKKIKTVYDGYVFQIYAQYFAMKEMGYKIKHLCLYSMEDNKTYSVELPEKNENMFCRFENTIMEMRTFSMYTFRQKNVEKCRNCIYEPACDRGLI